MQTTVSPKVPRRWRTCTQKDAQLRPWGKASESHNGRPLCPTRVSTVKNTVQVKSWGGWRATGNPVHHRWEWKVIRALWEKKQSGSS